MKFRLNPESDIEFDIDGDEFEIQYHGSGVHVFLAFKPVHVRAMIEYMTKVLPQLEKIERISQDCDLMNTMDRTGD